MAVVKLILSEDVAGLGEAGELVSVKPGHARNFLLPQGKALVATAAKVRELEHHKRAIAEKMARVRTELEAEKARIEKISLEVRAKAGDEGKLFGSVTTQQIAELLAEKGVEIDRRKIQLAEPIKELGEHTIELKLHRDLTASIRLNVSADE